MAVFETVEQNNAVLPLIKVLLYALWLKTETIMKKIAILGATGSVGTQAQDVALMRGYEVDFLSSNSDVNNTESAARRFKPRFVAMADEAAASELKVRLADTDTRVLFGKEGILYGIQETQADTVVNSILGEAGLLPTLEVIKNKKRLALANKESLVIAGDIVMAEAEREGVEILPVDSEHSAIFQSLKSGSRSEIKRILLTASGGPFFGKTKEELTRVSLEETLAHPTWKMGKKITVDSATLMNKGFELIEAVHLFSVGAEKIEILIHRESILHSAVEYADNAVIGEMSVPDMRACVQYAVDYPERREAVIEPLDFTSLSRLSFAKPDTEAFPLLTLARRAAADGGAMGAVLNAADEEAVSAFLKGKLSFAGISDVVISTYEKMTDASKLSSLCDILDAAKEARQIAKSYIKE